ncbi:hypothetical protein PR048_015443 [Dryococelus australis]|uniref:Uncharacterized protein n=1 Tax=Dryococelus australis TaxID=614101 RepID=A0ABQ9HH90_9NEOP|nr:hypothetical protein PR048_015443 [Dryococelus australis]
MTISEHNRFQCCMDTETVFLSSLSTIYKSGHALPYCTGPRCLSGQTTRLPPRRTGFDSRVGSLPDFRTWESCWTMPLVGGFSRGSPSLVFRRCSIPHFTLIGSQDLDCGGSGCPEVRLIAFNLRSYPRSLHMENQVDIAFGKHVFLALFRFPYYCIPSLLRKDGAAPECGRSLRKPSDQRYRPLRFPYAKTRARPRRELNPKQKYYIKRTNSKIFLVVSFTFTQASDGATVVQWLDFSPPTYTNRVRFPAGSPPDFRMWESCRTMPLVGGFSPESPVSPTDLALRHYSILTSLYSHRLSRPR